MPDVRRRFASGAQTIAAAPIAVGVGVVVLPIAHGLLRANVLSHRTLVDALPGTSRPAATPGDLGQARAIAQGLNLGASLWRLRRTSCLARSSLTWWLCRRRGIAADLRFGMSSDGSRAGHAWVEVAADVVNDAADVSSRFVTFDDVDRSTVA